MPVQATLTPFEPNSDDQQQDMSNCLPVMLLTIGVVQGTRTQLL